MPGRLASPYLHLPGQFDGRLHRFEATAEELGKQLAIIESVEETSVDQSTNVLIYHLPIYRLQ